MVNNRNLHSASLSNNQTDMNAIDEEYALELGVKDEKVAPSMWDGESDSSQGKGMLGKWDGRKETHHMFLRSYE